MDHVFGIIEKLKNLNWMWLKKTFLKKKCVCDIGMKEGKYGSKFILLSL